MKLAACIPPLFVVGCASTPTTSDSGPAERCETARCFYERDVREFEVVNRDTVIVYVGRQRCPFIVSLEGLTCDLSFTPRVQFFQTTLGRTDRISPVEGGQICGTTRGLVLYSGIVDPAFLLGREALDPATGAREPLGGGLARGDRLDRSIPVDPTSRDVCRVNDVRSINDEQLIELYVDEGVVPPPPPIGPGQLELPEESETAGAVAEPEEETVTGSEESDAPDEQPADAVESPRGESPPPTPE